MRAPREVGTLREGIPELRTPLPQAGPVVLLGELAGGGRSGGSAVGSSEA